MPRDSIHLILALLFLAAFSSAAQVLDKQKLLDGQTFWDNRDWDWYKANIPFFECPDADIQTIYYYRWELVTKHIVYGSPQSGYNFTEFIDRPFWSGRYGSISCPAGHQLYELRWLKDEDYARDYARYWFHTKGAQPTRYSTWLADSVWAINEVQHDDAFAVSLLDDLIENYHAWEKLRWVPQERMFWQVGHDDGMEYNITSRQTQDIVRGAPGYRPTLNAYMYADARAIAHIAALAKRPDIEKDFTAKADDLKKQVQDKLWDPDRQFFFHRFKQDETSKAGDKIKADTLTYQSGKFAGSPHGREEIGYVPWQFNLPDDGKGYEAAWKFLMDRNYFFADYGPTTTERNDPLFLITKTCCWWSGQSWPYATTQTLQAMANLLNNYKQNVVTRDDYVKLLKVYTATHHKDGKPYIAEGANPDTGSWQGYDTPGHSNHYFHSGYTDLIITGLAGLRPRADEVIEIHPLAPDSWDYFCLDDIAYRGRRVSIVWDKTGRRYDRGAGLHLIVDGQELASLNTLGKITAKLPPARPAAPRAPRPINYAVNNDGTRFPRASASYTAEKTNAGRINDGQYWYSIVPANRWTTQGSPDPTDWAGIDFGIARPIHTVKLYFLDDGNGVIAPARFELEYREDDSWKPIPGQQRAPQTPVGHRPNIITFPELKTDKIRAVFTHAAGGKTGLTEFETWGPGTPPIGPAPAPAGNLALNAAGKGFPKISASFTSVYDKVEEANDGKVSFNDSPRNRWTSYGSKNKTDWLEVEFNQPKTVARATLHIYDDRGGVQAPASYAVQYWDGTAFRDCPNQVRDPARPAGGRPNDVTFAPVRSERIRILFTHKNESRSGLTELELWVK